MYPSGRYVDDFCRCNATSVKLSESIYIGELCCDVGRRSYLDGESIRLVRREASMNRGFVDALWLQ